VHSVQAVLVFVQRHQQHMSMRAVSGIDAPLKKTGGGGGLVDNLDAGWRRAE
jgi:hypothetical protein